MKITAEKLIIPAFVLIIISFFILLSVEKPKPVQESKTFNGVDAAGFKHYPNGDIKRITLFNN